MPRACRERGAGVGQRRTACSGDGKGCWQGWKAPTEARSLSPWLWQLSLPLRSLRRHVVLMALGPQCLLAVTWQSWKLLCHCCPLLGLAHPTSHGPRKSPEPRVRDRTPLAMGWRSGLDLSASQSKGRVFSALQPPVQRLCLPAITASNSLL